MKALLVAAAVALAAGRAVADGPPSPPEGEKHLAISPGQTLQLQGGGAVTTKPDATDPNFGGIYAPPALARYDVEERRRRQVELEAAISVAADERVKGFVVGAAIGVAVGGAAGALISDGSTAKKLSLGIGSAAVGLVLWLVAR